MKKTEKTLLAAILAALACTAGTAAADDLLQIYRLAAESDPQLRAAEAARNAALEARPQSRALLLPSAEVSAGTSRERQKVEAGSGSLFTSQTSYFDTDRYSLDLAQPIYRRDRFIQLQQADSRIAQAEAQFASAQQELVVRVAERYFDVLAALDNLEFARAEKSAIARQLEQAQQRFDVGLIAITDVQEAQARYDLAVTQEISAENLLESSREALREVTGKMHEALAGLGPELNLIAPDPQSPEEWVKTALDQNLQLLAAQAAAETAQKEIERQRSGHYPTLDLVASHGWTDVGGGSFGGRETTDSVVGVQLNIPIFQGGLISSQTREARALYDQAREVLEQQRRATERQSRDAYRGVIVGISEVKALQQALTSTETALRAAEAGFEVGTRTIVDVLDAQRELYRARRDFARARYDYLLNTLRLKQAAGTLIATDLNAVNAWLK